MSAPLPGATPATEVVKYGGQFFVSLDMMEREQAMAWLGATPPPWTDEYRPGDRIMIDTDPTAYEVVSVEAVEDGAFMMTLREVPR